jgi:hypothetical protein
MISLIIRFVMKTSWPFSLIPRLTKKISKASLNGEFHRPGFQDVNLWYEIDVSLNA